jgi:hypothetical protein
VCHKQAGRRPQVRRLNIRCRLAPGSGQVSGVKPASNQVKPVLRGNRAGSYRPFSFLLRSGLTTLSGRAIKIARDQSLRADPYHQQGEGTAICVLRRLPLSVAGRSGKCQKLTFHGGSLARLASQTSFAARVKSSWEGLQWPPSVSTIRRAHLVEHKPTRLRKSSADSPIWEPKTLARA